MIFVNRLATMRGKRLAVGVARQHAAAPGILQRRRVRVPFGQNGGLTRPLDPQTWVEWVHAVFPAWSVRRGAKENDGCFGAKRHKPVAETLGNKDGPAGFIVEFNRRETTEARRTNSQVNHDVSDSSADAHDVFGLPWRHIGKMYPPDYPTT